MRFSFIPVASKLHDPIRLSASLKAQEQALQDVGGRRAGLAATAGEEAVFYFVQTGGVENEVIRHCRSRIQQGRGQPVLLIAHPAHNSLPAALEILAQVRQEGGQGRIYLLRGDGDAPTLAGIERMARCIAANRRLAEDRLGIVGAPSDWLVASSHRPEVVANRFGLRVIPLEVDELRAHVSRDPAPADGPEFALRDRAAAIEGISPEAFSRAVGVYRGLKELARVHGLSALTLRCFDLVVKDGTTGCLALALLADAGLTAGCEGDIPSVVLLRWLWHLTGQAGWMANPADLDVHTGEIRLAHCTVPLGCVGDYRFKTHFESGLGVAIDGTFPVGPVTLLRLGGAGLDGWWGAEGILRETRHDDGFCRTQVIVEIPSAAAAELLRAPLGNHLVLIRGTVLELFREAFELLAASPPAKGRCGGPPQPVD